MQSLILFMIGFPFLSAILLAIFKKSNIRNIITYASSAVLIVSAIAFAVMYFTGFDKQLFYFGENHIVDYVMAGVEIGLMILITVLSIKYKKLHAAALSIAQTVLLLVYEFGGFKPHTSIKNMYVDQLTVIMVLIIAVVGTLITVYACGYMKDYHHHHTEIKNRTNIFFALMYVFIGAMFGLVLSNNIIWMYFFWEITSVCSFLLIGYTKTEEAIKNCFTALWMNLFGGLGFAVAIFFAGVKYGIADIQSLIISDGAVVVLPVILLGFAALTKSAQLPFSKWLLGAMVAPTPSSALLHSATMVKAGVYLLIRLSPVMQGTLAGEMIAIVGGLTFFMMSLYAITASDGKKVLAYSTLSNLGLITACAGVGENETVWAAMFLVVFHAVSKSLLFQTVGSIEHQTGSRDIDSMHGLIRRYPHLALTLAIGIAGMFLAPFGMLVSKWAALKAFVDSSSIFIVLLVCFGSATTLLYWVKWLATILASTREDKRQKGSITPNQWTSMIVHNVLMVLLCFAFPFLSKYVFEPYLVSIYPSYEEVLSTDNIIIMIIMLALIFIIPFIAYQLITHRPIRYARADRYYNGAGTDNQTGFTDSFGEEKKAVLSNWYLQDYFSEKKLNLVSIISSIAIVFLCISIAIIGEVL